MARPLRIEYPGAIYHITSRGNARQPIYKDDKDRETFLDVKMFSGTGVIGHPSPLKTYGYKFIGYSVEMIIGNSV